MALTVNIGEAKTRLSQLVAAAERGEEIILARAGKPAVRLAPVTPVPNGFPFDCYRGSATPEELDEVAEPLDDATLAGFLRSPGR